MAIDAVTFGLTVTLIVLEVAGLPVAQEAEDVTTQLTISPSFRAVVLYVAELPVCSDVELTNHS